MFLPLFSIGYPIAGLLHSTLECFYSQTCTDNLTFHFGVFSEEYTVPRALNSSIVSRFQTNSTVMELFVESFIEYFSTSVSS